MGAAGYFRYDAAKPRVLIDTGSHGVREQLAPADQASAGLVTRSLDAENEWASHRAPPAGAEPSAAAEPSAGSAGPGGIGVTGSWRPRRITIASIPDGW